MWPLRALRAARATGDGRSPPPRLPPGRWHVRACPAPPCVMIDVTRTTDRRRVVRLYTAGDGTSPLYPPLLLFSDDRGRNAATDNLPANFFARFRHVRITCYRVRRLADVVTKFRAQTSRQPTDSIRVGVFFFLDNGRVHIFLYARNKHASFANLNTTGSVPVKFGTFSNYIVRLCV